MKKGYIQFRRVLLCAAALIMSLSLLSQSSGWGNMFQNEAYILIEAHENDSINKVFKKNTPIAYNAKNLPRFAIIGKNRHFYLGIGGYVKGTASYDFGSPINNGSYFTTSSIPTNLSPGNGGLFQMSAQTSNLFFNFIALPNAKHHLGAYVNFNFAGDNDYGFDLQYAYLTYGGLMIGYNFSSFFDAAASPATIDMEGPSSLPAVQHTLLNYTYSHKGWTFGIGIEAPQISITTDQYTSLVNQRIPDIPAFIQYGWNKGNSSVRISSLLRNLQYRNLVNHKNHNKVGWGFQLSGVTQIHSVLNFYYQGIYGKGISNFIQDTDGLGLDMVPDQNVDGKMKLVKIWAAMGGFQINFNPKVFSSHAYSQVRDYADNYKNGSIQWGSQYKYAQYLVNNIFWQATSSVQLGLEYIWGRKTVMDNTHRHDNRIQFMMQYSF